MRFFVVLERAAGFFAALSLATVALLTVSAVVLRALGANLPDALDFASLLMAVAVFWGASAAFLHDENIRADFVQHLVPAKVGAAIRIFGQLVTVLTLLVVAYAGLSRLSIAYNGGEVTPELRVAIWPFVALAWAGLAATAIAAAGFTLRLLRTAWPNRSSVPDSGPTDPLLGAASHGD